MEWKAVLQSLFLHADFWKCAKVNFPILFLESDKLSVIVGRPRSDWKKQILKFKSILLIERQIEF
ncbi:hypothetical protein DLM75_10690 [Leptospira stimsonii]|uniref:Uncharacterized protein n=1 Tax=Leptospira stimsonii TaxID=2202203 RepID=A0A396Z5Q9_9LEPT|nr:hypothetical protein DLM75_10690 [Leptospira stimsonii]